MHLAISLCGAVFFFPPFFHSFPYSHPVRSPPTEDGGAPRSAGDFNIAESGPGVPPPLPVPADAPAAAPVAAAPAVVPEE